MEQRQPEQQLGRRRHAEVASGGARQHLEVLLERLQDLVGVEAQVAHDLAEDVPLDLRECQAKMLICELHMVATARILDSAIDDSGR